MAYYAVSPYNQLRGRGFVYSRTLSTLCSVCRFVFEQMPAWHDPTPSDLRAEYISTPPGQTFERFLKAIKDECIICYRVWNYDRRRAEVWESCGTKAWCSLTYRCNVFELRDRGTVVINMKIYQESPAAVLFASNDAASFLLFHVDSEYYDLKPAIATVDCNTGSPESLQRAADWYKSCRSNHTLCSSLPTRKPGWIPSRLMDIGQAQVESWKLIVTADKAGKLLDTQYATLSYRWGSKQQALILNTSTLGKFLRANPIADLPQTFKDFIVVARKLGFKYVWIDCLCIIQDCSQDWNHEVSIMSDVYANSGCNVLACDSADPGGGLFRYRTPSDIVPGLVETSLCSGKPSRYAVGDDMILARQLDDVKPLANRGWIFQERFLAPRLLSFHGPRISWKCCEGRQWEGEPLPPHGFIDSISIMNELLVSVQQNPEASQGQMTKATLRLWARVVESYSQCKLTKSEDKLVAFAGVAKVFQELTGDAYLAGVWRSQLLPQLDWYTEQDVAKLPRQYRAPSWSWACVDSPVTTSFTSNYLWQEYIPQKEIVTLLEILDVGATSNAYGGMADVTDAWLKVRGKCFGCSYEKQAHGSECSFLIRPDGDTGLEFDARVYGDATEYEFADEGRTVLLLYIVKAKDFGRTFGNAMVLLPVHGSDSIYRRIGWVLFHLRCARRPADRGWFRRIEASELLIV